MRALRLLARWLAVMACITGLAGVQGAQAQRPPSLSPPAGPGPNWIQAALGRAELPQAPADLLDLNIPDGCGRQLVNAGVLASLPIADPPASNSVVTATVNITQSVPYAFAVVAVTSISHTSPGDLVIDLISPDGTDATLSNRRGGGHSDAFTTTEWVDLSGIGAVPVTEADFSAPGPVRIFVPEEAMGAFAGKPVQGAWKLVVADKAAGDIGTLNWFSLFIYGLSRPITTTTHYSQYTPAILSDTVDLNSPLLVNGSNDRVISARLTTNISHGKPRQLSLELGAPGAITIPLSIHNGGYFSANFADWFNGTVWDDKAGDLYPPGPVTMDQAVYQTSPLAATVPEGAMSQFTGIRPDGVWNLHITDNTLGGGGTLNSWGLDLTTAHCLPFYLPVVARQ